ncbi:sulfite exporter TauE/SafE family protein [Sphingobacterium corticis]|uniref:Sulfite exporter TauE/SafE family protein n=1 Tax=Sphingobacterium corticis TaxID=1812823 RepID=A0ABW5NHB5_9SPHI
MGYAYFAFFMGFFGSMHCAVMCGPLMFSITSQGKSAWHTAISVCLYHVGRVVVYGLLGLLFGVLGQIGKMAGWQQAISLISGALLIGIGLFQVLGIKWNEFQKMQNRWTQPFVKSVGKWMFRPGGSLVVGMLNGLLPCGMVYMALTSAVNANGLWGSFLFMVAFGLGTWPLIFLMSAIVQITNRRIKWRFSWFLPSLYILLGVWFLLRGANLDIPFLSPILFPEGSSHCA